MALSRAVPAARRALLIALALVGCGRTDTLGGPGLDGLDGSGESEGSTTGDPSSGGPFTGNPSTGPGPLDTTGPVDPPDDTTGPVDPPDDTGPPLGECGDGVLDPPEECDDGNAIDHDACHDDCTLTRVVRLALGGNHSCALVDNGALRCWGNGNNGRTGLGTPQNLGDDEPPSSAPPVSLLGPAVALAAGLSHTCVLDPAGQLSCFGRAAEGQLGYGNADDVGDDEPPAAVGPVLLPAPVVALGTRGGSFHGCALLQGGTVRCWGLAADGRLGVPGLTGALGDDEPVTSAPPVDVGGPVVQLVTGALHTCARLADGTLRCWGSNASGQLGTGSAETIGDDEPPAAIGPVSVGGSVQHVTAGFHHTCALLDTGAVRCWGRGNDGRLGYGNTAWVGVTNTPADVGLVDVGGPVVQLEAGNAHTCALLAGGTVRCWGWGSQGQLGYGNGQSIGDDEPPSAAGDVPVGGLVVQIAADGNHTCALLDTGGVRCWGNGGDGRLGYGNLDTIGDDETPAEAGDVPLVP